MFGGKKNLYLSFARVSPVFAALGSVLTLAAATPAKTNAEAAATVTVRRQAASTQFARAEEQRAALNSKPTEKRTLADYKQVVTGYRRVALITPRAPEVPDSLLAVAELYTEMGDRFGRKRMFIGGLMLFTVSSAAAAVAPSIGLLIAARAIQGWYLYLVRPNSSRWPVYPRRSTFRSLLLCTQTRRSALKRSGYSPTLRLGSSCVA